jgi:hypothetical protein
MQYLKEKVVAVTGASSVIRPSKKVDYICNKKNATRV